MASLSLVVGDITRQRVDAIVNAANAGLVGGGGVDGAIHHAGGPSIMEECDRISAQGGCPTGHAVATTAGKLAAKAVIHAVGPCWRGGRHGEERLLASAYRSSLELAASRGYRTLAFPSISTGVYGYPIQKASEVALRTILDTLEERPGDFDEVKMVLFSKKDLEVYTKTRKKLESER